MKILIILTVLVGAISASAATKSGTFIEAENKECWSKVIRGVKQQIGIVTGGDSSRVKLNNIYRWMSSYFTTYAVGNTRGGLFFNYDRNCSIVKRNNSLKFIHPKEFTKGYFGIPELEDYCGVDSNGLREVYPASSEIGKEFKQRNAQRCHIDFL